ncbi:MAG: DUF6064 family protein [Bacteroidales bacterium]|nr:DUF6064 family protein [Bacteroidales bacterium]
MNFDPEIFGEGFHRFVQMEIDLFSIPLGIIFHIFTLIILYLIYRYGNRYRKLFSIYFAFNWLFLFGYWGVYAIIYWSKVGIPYLASYSLTPVLLGLIVIHWIKEITKPKIDFDFKNIKSYKFIVLLIMIWGFWYPTYIYGQGFTFSIKDILLSNYGLMPCPTTMVVLGLLTLKYPNVNKSLYNIFTIYALFIGTATVLSGWLPDIPFIILGIYSLCLIFYNKRKVLKNKRINERSQRA